MRPENFQEKEIELNGWPVKLTSFKLGEVYWCQADNVSPGACLARMSADSAEEAEKQAISKASHMLGKTQKHSV